jgi:hypothetical protein
VNPDGSTGCNRTHTSTFAHVKKTDYIPHHQPFQFYPQTANPMHVRPTSVAMIGQPGDAANHQYDIDDFFAAASAGNVPAVSFVKAAGYQDGHASYSTPLDEQTFLVNTINFLQQLPEYKTMAIIVAWDDSDGWYDHQPGPLVNGSTTSADALTGPGACGSGPTISNQQGRCGYGLGLPLLVISPFAKRNFVDHTVTDQSSILRFIETTGTSDFWGTAPSTLSRDRSTRCSTSAVRPDAPGGYTSLPRPRHGRAHRTRAPSSVTTRRGGQERARLLASGAPRPPGPEGPGVDPTAPA